MHPHKPKQPYSSASKKTTSSDSKSKEWTNKFKSSQAHPLTPMSKGTKGHWFSKHSNLHSVQLIPISHNRQRRNWKSLKVMQKSMSSTYLFCKESRETTSKSVYRQRRKYTNLSNKMRNTNKRTKIWRYKMES